MHDLTAGRRDAMAFTAMGAPVALLLGGKGMLWALPALALAALLYGAVAKKLQRGESLAARLPRGLCVLETVFLIAAMAKAASLAPLCWSSQQGTFPLFSFALLGLAAAGASLGSEAASRGAVVLTWAFAVFFAILLGPTAWQSRTPQSVGVLQDGAVVFGVLLAGMCALFLPSRGTSRAPLLWGATALLVLLVLYVSWGKPGEVPLLTAVKGAELFGTLQRYEAFASCAMTIGLYQLLVLLACAAAEMLEQVGTGPIALLFLPAAALIFVIGNVPGAAWLGGAAIFWGLIPLLATRSWDGKKDAEKGEKSS